VTIFDASGEKVVLTFRLAPVTSHTVERSSCLHLQEILIVGSKAEQARFSEMTIDMFRMLQTLEREPQDDASAAIPCLRRENPHKYLLFKPALDNLLVYLSAGLKDVEPGGVLLLYLSGDPVGSGDSMGHGRILMALKNFDKNF
jgi:hypothetical protein